MPQLFSSRQALHRATASCADIPDNGAVAVVLAAVSRAPGLGAAGVILLPLVALVFLDTARNSPEPNHDDDYNDMDDASRD